MTRILTVAITVLLALGLACHATVTETVDWVSHDCDATTTAFTFAFPIQAATDLKVLVRDEADANSPTETPLVLNSTFTLAVSNNLYPATGGTVTTITTYDGDCKLIITTDIERTQSADMDYTWRPVTFEDALDKAMLLFEELNRRINKCVRVPESDDTADDLELPTSGTAGYLWRGANGDMSTVANVTVGNQAIGTFWQNTLPGATLAAAQDDLRISAGWIDVKNSTYGATGDGLTDDTAALQAAINDAVAYGYGILIPKGNYRIVTTLTVGNGISEVVGLQIIGAGLPKILWDGSASDIVLDLVSVGRSQITGVEIDGNDCAGTVGLRISTSGALISGQADTFTTVQVNNCPRGGVQIAQHSNATLDYMTFTNCYIIDCTPGVRIDGGAREVSFVSGAILESDSYAVDVNQGQFYSYETFYGTNATADFHIGNTLARIKIYGGGSESATILTTSGSAATGDVTLGPNIISGFHQDKSTATSPVIDYNAYEPLLLIGCRFENDVDIGPSSLNVISIGTEFVTGGFIGETDKILELGRNDVTANLFLPGVQILAQALANYPKYGIHQSNQDAEDWVAMYRDANQPDSYYYEDGDLVFRSKADGGYPMGWVCYTSGDFATATTKAKFAPLATLPGGVPKTDDFTVLVAENGRCFTNHGAVDGDADANQITATLPAAAVGLRFVFRESDANDLRIDPVGTDLFRGHAAGKYLRLDDQNCYVEIECGETGIWDINGSYDPNCATGMFKFES